jgi:hypothetical protein
VQGPAYSESNSDTLPVLPYEELQNFCRRIFEEVLRQDIEKAGYGLVNLNIEVFGQKISIGPYAVVAKQCSEERLQAVICLTKLFEAWPESTHHFSKRLVDAINALSINRLHPLHSMNNINGYLVTRCRAPCVAML